MYYRALKEHATIRDDLLTKQILINDQQKRMQQMNKELKDFASAYAVRNTVIISSRCASTQCLVFTLSVQIVKAERNKAHTQIYLMQQVLAELTEKSKILANESEILRNALNEKDK